MPTSLAIEELLTDEEQAYLGEWDDRYECPWPYITGQWIQYRMPRRVHPQLVGLYERYKEVYAQWEEAVEHEPYDGDFNYVVRNYYNGELHTQIAHMREPDPLEGLIVDVEEKVSWRTISHPRCSGIPALKTVPPTFRTTVPMSLTGTNTRPRCSSTTPTRSRLSPTPQAASR